MNKTKLVQYCYMLMTLTLVLLLLPVGLINATVMPRDAEVQTNPAGVALYDQEGGTFYVKEGTAPGPADRTFRYGPRDNNWLSIAGDWNGNGTFGVALYNQANGTFYMKNDTTPGPADRTFRYGPRNNDWIPVAGDWDGNGIYGIALYDQAGGLFYIKNDSSPGPADRTFRYGPRNNDWIPVAGDWDGNGIYGVALYDQAGGLFYAKDGSTPGPADRAFRYGPRNNNWLPVAGDWDGNDIYGVALYDQAGGLFYIKDDSTPGPADRTFRYGPRNNVWLPTAGRWLEDVSAEPVIFTIYGDGITSGSKGYTLSELQAFDKHTGSYSYRSGGTNYTDIASGVLMQTLLADAGVTAEHWQLSFTASDGYSHETYVVTLSEAIEKQYLLAYEVNDSLLSPEGTLYVFRNHDDGGSWLNRMRDINQVTVVEDEESKPEPDLLITGTGLTEDVYLYKEDWEDFDNPLLEERYFSVNNAVNRSTIWKVKGYDLFDMFDQGGLIEGTDWVVTFTASDDFTVQKTVSELDNLYYYSDFTAGSGVKVDSMIASFRKQLFNQQNITPPVSWTDQDLLASDSDENAPRLYIGQAEGDPTDQNSSSILRDLVRIVVGEERPQEPGDDDDPDDFANSTYKHINYDGAPYNVDSITGATFTIEGPGVESYRALSLRQIEEANAGLARDTYDEKIGSTTVQNSYEGIKVSYLLDYFVNLRSNAGAIIFKNKSRQTISEYSLEEIRSEERGMIVAYGVNGVPLVYTEESAGYLPEKGNSDGCFKLVYHQEQGLPLPTFSNVAYIYVTEADATGIYEHSYEPYNDPKFTNYILSMSGSGLGKEVNYTVSDIEAMVDLHFEKEYSLSNSYYYWYYNTYKGVPLWNLLLEAGLDPDIDESTPVNFIAADYYNFPPMTIGEIKNSDLYGYYEKDSEDMGDGNFDGSGVEPLDTGYPVLVAYGYNGYPYVTHASDPGYNSGLGNAGGPLRIIFGKRDYAHTNGSHQVKFAKRIIIGDPVNHTTHTGDTYGYLADSPLLIEVYDEDENLVKTENLTVADIENYVYGGSAVQRDQARVKAYYYTHNAGGGSIKISDLYEGVGLYHLLFEKIGLPGTLGTVTFENEGNTETITVSLDDIVKSDYFNEVNGAINLKPLLAFGKNGYPMVKTSADQGYLGNPIVNRWGPLMALFGQTTEGTAGLKLANVQKITVNISKDTWAHLDPPYDSYADDLLTINGSGVREVHEVSVNALQQKQRYIFTAEYCLASGPDPTDRDVATYRGIDIYEYIRQEVGFTAGADSVIVKLADDTSKTYSLAELAKRDYINEESGAGNLPVMLAYGRQEKPLVPFSSSEGYDATADNKGGPLRLIIGQAAAGDQNADKAADRVVEITIETAGGDSWKHDFGVYTQYQDQAVLRITGSQVKEPITFSLAQLEALNEHIIRDTYNGVADWEGVILWKLIKDVVGLADGVTTPSSIRVYAGHGYNQLPNTSQVMNGVVNSQGVTKDIILAYAVNGNPLVPYSSSDGYVGNNQYGPLRLIVEENGSMWVKWVDCIVVGDGFYEEPKAEDIVYPDPVWQVFRNDDASGLPNAEVRCVTPDNSGGFWVGTNGGGAAYRNSEGSWTVYNTSNSELPHNTIYDIAVDADGGVWLVGGAPAEGETPEQGLGLVYKTGDTWAIYDTENSDLPANFAQALAIDDDGGLWVGTAAGPAYRDSYGVWTTYDKNDGFPASSVTVITLDSKGGAWFGFYPERENVDAPWTGGYAYRSAEGVVTAHDDESGQFFGSWVRSISEDKDGGIWVARFSKVDYIDPDGVKTVYNDSDILPDLQPGNSIRVIEADQAGGIWIGQTTGGLAYKDSEAIIENYTYENPFPTPQFNSVWCLQSGADGQLWVGTNGGVAYLPE